MPIHNRYIWPSSIPVDQISPASLLQSGPIITVEVTIPSELATLLEEQNHPIPQPVTGFALIDTGASRSCVDDQVISSLGVNPIGVTATGTAVGSVQRSLYPARFRFPRERLDIEFSSVVGVDLTGQQIAGRDIIVLFGRDVLSRCVFIYNGVGSFYTLAF